jgi:hypothetical protein
MPLYLKHRIQTFISFLYKEKLFNISIYFKLTTIYYVLSDDLHGHTTIGIEILIMNDKVFNLHCNWFGINE